MRVSRVAVLCLCVSLALLALASAADAARLIATYRNVSLPERDSLWEIDPATGASTRLASLPERIWGGLSGREIDPSGIYAVTRIPGSSFENTVSRVDLGTGAVADLHTFTGADFGLRSDVLFELEGIAIAPATPGVATISAAAVDFVLQTIDTILFDIDLETGDILSQQLFPTTLLTDVTLAPDGDLYGILNEDPRVLGLVDRSVPQITPIIACDGCTIRSMSFDPESGELLAVDFFGLLLRISPETAETLDEIGQTGLGFEGQPASVTGLAFVVPEPGTGALIAVGLFLLARVRRDRR